MKVLFLSDFFLSGQSTHVLELAKQLNALGVEVHLAFGTIHSKLFWSDYTPYLKRHNIPFTTCIDFQSLINLSNRFKPDLIHAQSSTLFKKARFLSSLLNTPYILTCHGLGFNKAQYRSLFLNANGIIAIGPKVAAEIADLNSRIRVILNGIDTEHFIPPEHGSRSRKEIYYIGRLEQKRIDALLHLADSCKIVTKKPLKIISNRNPGIADTVFVPWQLDLVPHLQKAGIVAACGRTAREAMSTGNAVVLMQQKYDGIISPQLITRKDFDFSGNLDRFPFTKLQADLRKLVHSRYRLKKLQEWSHNYSKAHLCSSKMATETLAFYRQIVKSP